MSVPNFHIASITHLSTKKVLRAEPKSQGGNCLNQNIYYRGPFLAVYVDFLRKLVCKVGKFLKGSMDSIPLPSPPVNI